MSLVLLEKTIGCHKMLNFKVQNSLFIFLLNSITCSHSIDGMICRKHSSSNTLINSNFAIARCFLAFRQTSRKLEHENSSTHVILLLLSQQHNLVFIPFNLVNQLPNHVVGPLDIWNGCCRCFLLDHLDDSDDREDSRLRGTPTPVNRRLTRNTTD